MAPVGLSRYTKQAAVIERRARRSEQVPVFEAALAAILAGELRAARSALGSKLVEAEFRAWMDEFYPTLSGLIVDDLSGPVTVYGTDLAALAAREIGGDTPSTAAVGALATAYTASMADRWVRSSIAQYMATLRDEQEPEQVIRDRLDRWEGNRAGLTAASEATKANGAFSRMTYMLGGVDRMVWRSLGKSCPLCTEMDGRTIGVTDMFLEEGAKVVGSGPDGEVELVTHQPIGHPPLHGVSGGGGICDCMVVAA